MEVRTYACAYIVATPLNILMRSIWFGSSSKSTMFEEEVKMDNSWLQIDRQICGYKRLMSKYLRLQSL